ncbi:interleukin-18 isoform X1 [Python bivittatus]|uniref:Interleukin-18 isoform X1 n=1 Tax=Python bivittatus TaxID=176946 RepID=A0A9F2N2U5_PYTBI|nr:interleukin-18 isoform X1 [Python bivittatus]
MCTELVSMHPVHLDEEGILYFEEQVLETDSWKRSGKCESSQIFRNHNNHVLVAHPSHEDLQAVFEHITDQEILKVPGIKFDIHSYQDSKPKGLSVAFTVEWNHQIYHMYVEKRESKMKVKFKKGGIPQYIEGDTSNMIFIKTRFSDGSRQFFRFESALERGYFLAFEWDQDSHATKLVAKKIEVVDEVDESIKLHHAPPL